MFAKFWSFLYDDNGLIYGLHWQSKGPLIFQQPNITHNIPHTVTPPILVINWNPPMIQICQIFPKKNFNHDPHIIMTWYIFIANLYWLWFMTKYLLTFVMIILHSYFSSTNPIQDSKFFIKCHLLLTGFSDFSSMVQSYTHECIDQLLQEDVVNNGRSIIGTSFSEPT